MGKTGGIFPTAAPVRHVACPPGTTEGPEDAGGRGGSRTAAAHGPTRQSYLQLPACIYRQSLRGLKPVSILGHLLQEEGIESHPPK